MSATYARFIGTRKVVVDFAFMACLESHRWHIDKYGYVRRHVSKSELRELRRGEKPTRLLHHFIRPPEPGFRPVWLNGDRLDCRRDNLVLRSCAEAARIACRPSNNKWGHTGVHGTWNGKFAANMKIDGRNVYLGQFDTALAAGLAYSLAKARMASKGGAR